MTDPSQEPHVKAEDIAKWFGVSMVTMHSKSKVIRERLGLVPFDPAFCLRSRTDIALEDWHGHKLDRRLLTLLQKH